jgi:hypothetical protein
MQIGDEVLRVLDEVAEWLAWAWGIDKKFPKDYPANTGNAFHEIKARIREAQAREHGARSVQPGDVQANENKTLLPKSTKLRRLMLGVPPPPPKRFSDLVNEVAVKVVYEDQNADSYKDALLRAARGDRPTFRKILSAVERAHRIDRLGVEAAPRPRIHFLHANLLQLASLLEISNMKHEGILEFLEDLCPCGKEHRPDAIRKLRKRWSEISKKRS